MHTVADILSVKGRQFNNIDAHASVMDALHIMKSENLHYLVVFEKGKYAGIFSQNDYLRNIPSPEKQPLYSPVKDVMSSKLPMVNAKDSAKQCMKLMNMYHTGCLPVFDEFNFKGVIGIDDLMTDLITGIED